MPKRNSKNKEPIDELVEEFQGANEEIKTAAKDRLQRTKRRSRRRGYR